MTSKEIQPHTQEELNGKPLYIKEYISNGATANVFKGIYGQTEVAVKAMREGARGGFYSEFEKEAENIRIIWEKWIEHGFSSPQVIPELITSDVKSSYPVLVEEFIDGRRLDHAMRDLPGNVFSEPQALFLASQIGRLLMILHEDLMKSYGDIKFANFLIVGDAAQNPEPALKIFDWNVLGYPTDRNKRKDLLIISNYLLFMLTGEMLPIDHDNLQVIGRPASINGFNTLTAGTRQFLETSLHPAFDRRFQSAAKWLERLSELLGWWREDSVSLLRSTQLEWADLERRPNLVGIMNALARAEILVHRNVEGASKLCDSIREEVSGSKIVERIKKQLWQGQFERAREDFEKERDQAQDLGLAPVMLWGWLANAVGTMDGYTDHRALIEQCMQDRLQENFLAASEGFQQLLNEFQDNRYLIELSGESKVLALLKEADEIQFRDQEFDKLMDKYGQALQLTKTLPDDLRSLAIVAWNPEERLRETRLKNEGLIVAKELLQQALVEDALSKKIDKIGEALEQTPVQSIVLEPLRKMVQELLDSGEYEEAEKLAYIPLQQGRGEEWFDEAVNAARRLVVLKDRIHGLRQGAPTLQPIVSYLSESDTHSPDGRIFPKAFIELTLETIKALRLESLSDSELESACKVLAGMQQFAQHYPEFQQHMENAVSQQHARTEARGKSGEQVHALINKMNVARTQLNALKLLSLSGLEKITPVLISEEMERLMKEMLKSLSDLEHLDAHSPHIAEYAGWLADSFGLDAWLRVRRRVEENIRFNGEELEARFSECIERGDLSTAAVLLGYLEKNGNDAHRSRYEDIKDFLEWSAQLPADKDKALTWINKGIPRVYWEQGQNGLPGAAKIFLDKANAVFENFNMDALPGLVYAWWIYQRARGVEKSASKTWDEVERRAKIYKNSIVNKAKPKIALQSAIESLESPLKPESARPPALKRSPWWNNKLIWGGGFLVVLVLLSAFVLYRNSTMSQGTSTPEPAIPTPSATSTSTPEPTPTQLSEATPIPPSAYTWDPAQVTSALAVLPPGVEFLYLLDGSPAVTYIPETSWLTKPDEASLDAVGVGGSLRYINSKQLEQGEAFVEWRMDVPMDRTGLYAFFINDTFDFSGTTNPVTYNLFVGDETVPRAPDFGEAAINQIFMGGNHQTQDMWRGIGMYFLQAGDMINIRVQVSELVNNDMFAADALVIAFVPEIDSSMPYLLHVPDGRKILYWADDAQAISSPAEGWQFITETATWLGARSIDLAAAKDVSVKWTFTERLSPGKYEVFVFIPQELTVDAAFDVRLDSYEKLTPEILSDSGAGGTYQSLGTVEVTKELNGILTVEMTPKNAQTGTFAYDNVFIVRVEGTDQ